MNQTMKEIKKSCQDNVNQLGQTYRPMFEQIEKKLRKDVHAGEALESALLDLSEMLLEAEAAGLTKDEVFPDGLDAFYEELIQALPVITQKERARKKKRIGLGVMAAIAAVILFVWGTGQMSLRSDSYVEGQDHPYMYRTYVGASTAYVKGEHDYFFMRGKYLYRFDPDTQKASPLCTQEDCLHSRQPDALHYDMCNANVLGDTYQSRLGYWDGYVYYIASHDRSSYYTLNRVKEDGSEGETLKKFRRRHLESWNWIIHRGYLYFVETEEYTNDHTLNYTIKRLSLEKPDKEEMVYQTIQEDYVWLRFSELGAYGNYLYFVQSDTKEVGDIKIFTYDLRSHALREITLPSECDGYPGVELVIHQGKLLIYAHHDLVETGTKDKVYMTDLDGRNVNQITLDVYGIPFSDEKYLYMLTNESVEDDKVELYVLDDTGRVIDSVSFDQGLFDLEFSVGDKNGILCIDSSDERKMWDIYWIDKDEIGSWNGSRLEWEPVDELRYGYAYVRYLTGDSDES